MHTSIYTGIAEVSPGVVVVVEEAGGAVETEGGGWEVEAAESEEKVIDSAAVGEGRENKIKILKGGWEVQITKGENPQT